MADLKTAFCSPFGSSPCSLNFDIVPLYTTEGGDNRHFLGVVSIESGDELNGFSYRVYPASSTSVNPFETARTIGNRRNPMGSLRGHPLLQAGFGEERRAVTEGTVTDSNNMTFTFPITGMQHDYFVLVTPSRSPVQPPSFGIGGQLPGALHACVSKTPQQAPKPEFAIFYTTKVLKERKTRIKKRNTPASVPSRHQFMNRRLPIRLQKFFSQDPDQTKLATPPNINPANFFVSNQGEVVHDKELTPVDVALKNDKGPWKNRTKSFATDEWDKKVKDLEEGRQSDDTKVTKPQPTSVYVSHKNDQSSRKSLNDKLRAMEEGRRTDDAEVTKSRDPKTHAVLVRAFNGGHSKGSKVKYCEGTEFVPASRLTKQYQELTKEDFFLPNNDIAAWADVYPNKNYLHAGHHINTIGQSLKLPTVQQRSKPQNIVGINTVGQSLKHPNYQLRSEPPNPDVVVSPWLNSSYGPDLTRRSLEIGGRRLTVDDKEKLSVALNSEDPQPVELNGQRVSEMSDMMREALNNALNE